MKLFLVLLLVAFQVKALDIEVDSSSDGTLASLNGNGTCSLREAIANANNNNNAYSDCDPGSGADRIIFSGVSNITVVDEIFIITDIKIEGAVTISGGNSTRIFNVSGSSAVLRLDEVTLQNGFTSGAGGAITQSTSSLIDCKESVFKNNVAQGNGGAVFSSGTFDIDDCSFENNQAGNDGGAIYKNAGFPLTINGSNFADNKAGTDPAGQTDGGVGGAIYHTAFTVNITGSRFNKNTARSGQSTNSGGGAIHNANGTMNITASVFAGNSVSGDSWHGGAIFNSGLLSLNFSHLGTTPIPLPAPFNTLTDPNTATGQESLGGAVYTSGPALVVGTSFLGNTSAFGGGAFANTSASDDVTIANSSFGDNMASNQGGAIYHFRDDALLTIINTTITQNTALEGGGIYNEGDGDNLGGTLNDEILLQNVILSENSAPIGANCGGGTASEESANSVSYPVDCPAAVTLSEDPKVGSPELTFSIPNIVTYASSLGSGSSALGAGDNSICVAPPILSVDQRAFPRPQGDPDCDVGSYESANLGATNTPTPTNTSEPTATPTYTYTPEPTATFTPTIPGPTATNTPEPTATFTPTIPGPTATFTPTPELTVTATPTNTAEPTATFTPTAVITATPTSTSEPTATFTPTVPGPTATNTPEPTATFTPVITASATPTNTPESTATFTPTVPGPTATNTPEQTATSTPVVTASATNTPTSTVLVDCAGVSGGTSVLDRCGVCNGDGQSCLGCTTTQNTQSQLGIDGRAAAQRDIILKLLAKYKKLGGAGTNDLATKANSLYRSAWSLAWSLPAVSIECTSTQFCTSVDNSEAKQGYESAMQGLTRMVKRISKKVDEKAGSHVTRRYLKRAEKNRKSALVLLGKIPSSTSSCS